ncbi:MAG: hypothetical protein ACT4OK_13525 [Gemmobacter sp.]
MSIVRPEAVAALTRWREVIAAGGVALAGVWVAWLGGYLLVPLGLAVIALAAVWGFLSLRRLRFAQGVLAPGWVEVDEGQVGYLGPAFGGYVALPDLVEIRLLTMRGRRLWRLKQADGQVLLVPVDAAGAERLYDAFASLPGLASSDLLAALETAGPNGQTLPAPDASTRVVWRRAGVGRLPGAG